MCVICTAHIDSLHNIGANRVCILATEGICLLDEGIGSLFDIVTNRVCIVAMDSVRLLGEGSLFFIASPSPSLLSQVLMESVDVAVFLALCMLSKIIGKQLFRCVRIMTATLGALKRHHK